MNPLLIYLLKAALCIAVLYLIYFVFLSRDTLYERNRFYILLSFLSALILPLIAIQTQKPHDIQFFGQDLTGITINGSTDSITTEVAAPFLWQHLLMIIYLAGVLIAGLKLLAEVIRVLMLITRKKSGQDSIICLSGSGTSGFSAFGHIFIDKELTPDEAEEIIKHEQKHLDRFHFFDIIVVEIIKVFQWFNPFMYMFDRSLRAVHEYQADEECLNSGIPVHSYQGLVMNQVFRTRIFSASNSFSNPTLIKKRMIMMTKKRSKMLANLKILLVLPVTAVLLFVFSTCTEKISTSDTQMEAVALPSTAPVLKSAEPEPFVIVEKMPRFPGGDTALLRYIGENTKYPAAAKENNIQGRVIVRFCVTELGTVDKISVLKGVNPELDKEAMRVVSTLPEFKPGQQGGKDVPVWYMVPITFALKGDSIAPPPPPPPPTGEKVLLQENVKVVMEQPDAKSPAPFIMVEEMPQFPGGDTTLLKYIAENTKYPESAKINKITGRVIVRFVVTETGSVDKMSVLKGVDPALDAEALRVCSTLPAFKPGKQGGKEVPVWYMVPITFSLK